MKTIIVDDEELAIKQFELESEGMADVQIVAAFTRSSDALQYVREHPVELVLLDIEMPQMNGIELGKRIREIYPDIVLIFITGYEKYAIDAWKLKADYYLTKPYKREDIEYVIRRAKLLVQGMKRRVYFRTFGRFDLFIDGEMIHMSNAKAKELLALCVDHRGGTVTMEEAVDKLWEDRAYDRKVKNLYRKAVMCLKQTFRAHGVDDVFESGRGTCNIVIGKVECDYYKLMEGKQKDVGQKLSGYYLSEYSWAEETAASLEDYEGGYAHGRGVKIL